MAHTMGVINFAYLYHFSKISELEVIGPLQKQWAYFRNIEMPSHWSDAP